MENWQYGLEDELTKRGLTHLRVKRFGKALLVVSGDPADPFNHFRLKLLPRQQWAVSMGTRGDKWEPTPFQGTFTEVVALVTENFPWILEPRE